MSVLFAQLITASTLALLVLGVMIWQLLKHFEPDSQEDEEGKRKRAK